MKTRLLSYLVATLALALRLTIRVRYHNDPRPELRRQGKTYLYSFLHAHQLALIIGSEKGTGAMVSRSRDGELIVVILKMMGLTPVRGSSRMGEGEHGERGGLEALQTLSGHMDAGRPVAIAVDGPRGPRGRVHKGVALLSQRTGAPVLNLVAIAKRKWTFTKAWDRMQVPKPFSVVHGYYSDPIYPVKGEKLEAYRRRIEANLLQLEAQFDPSEAAYNVTSMLGDTACVPSGHAPLKDGPSLGGDLNVSEKSQRQVAKAA